MSDGPHLPRGERKRALVDARHRRRCPFGQAEQAAVAPVGEPEDDGDPERPGERRGEHGVDRAHVRDDRAAAEAAQLGRDGSLEPRPATRLRPRPKRADAAVRRQRLGNHAVREHDELVHPGRERTNLRHRRRECRVSRIDLLRDEDELRCYSPHQSWSSSASPLGPAPKTSSSIPSGPASKPRPVCGATRTASHCSSLWTPSSSFTRPPPETTT